MQSGQVEAIYIGAVREADLVPVERARAVAGRGLEGDRYCDERGTFSDRGRNGRDITLIEAEAIEGLARDAGIELSPGEARRNVLTRGVSLNDLVGKRFKVGEVECLGRRLCDPCSHLEGLTRPGVLKGLARRGGLRADLVTDGWIAVGAPVREIPAAD
jgi:MOSC domain-containing protein YiiM